MHSSVDVDAVQTCKSSVKMVLGSIPAGSNPKQTVFSQGILRGKAGLPG